MKRKLYMVVGILFMAVGTLGYILPVLPGTIFMILAAYCFLQSSENLYKKVVGHSQYGHPIKQYIENNHIEKNTKIVILISMWIATLFSVFYINLHLYFNVFTVFLSLIGSVFVLKANS